MPTDKGYDASMPSPDGNEEDHLGMLIAGRYLVERRLGSGNHGMVYLAIDQKTHSNKYAIKFLRKLYLTDTEVHRKFKHEIEALRRIRHSKVVKIVDDGELDDGQLFFLMEYVEGKSLDVALQMGLVSFEMAAMLARHIGSAVSAMHAEGIYHRDLKPGNILLEILSGGEAQAKLVDLGVARVENPVSAPGTVGNMIFGTPEYMAPEQLRGEAPTNSTDVYALGVIFYEILTGRLPFPPTPSSNLQLKILEIYQMQQQGLEDKRLPKRLRPEMPERAQEVLLNALSFNPEDRHQQASDFGELLAQALTTEIQVSSSTDTVPPNELELAHVLITDIVGFAKMQAPTQIRFVDLMIGVVQETTAFREANAARQAITVSTGDGMIVVFFTRPARPAECAKEIALALKSYPGLRLRMGIHTGPVIRKDILMQKNAIGNGISIAERVRSCGDPDHILVSKATADFLNEIPEWSDCLHELGQCRVKHGQRVHLFNLYDSSFGNRARPKIMVWYRRWLLRILLALLTLLLLSALIPWRTSFQAHPSLPPSPGIQVSQVGSTNARQTTIAVSPSPSIEGTVDGPLPADFRIAAYARRKDSDGKWSQVGLAERHEQKWRMVKTALRNLMGEGEVETSLQLQLIAAQKLAPGYSDQELAAVTNDTLIRSAVFDLKVLSPGIVIRQINEAAVNQDMQVGPKGEVRGVIQGAFPPGMYLHIYVQRHSESTDTGWDLMGRVALGSSEWRVPNVSFRIPVQDKSTRASIRAIIVQGVEGQTVSESRLEELTGNATPARLEVRTPAPEISISLPKVDHQIVTIQGEARNLLEEDEKLALTLKLIDGDQKDDLLTRYTQVSQGKWQIDLELEPEGLYRIEARIVSVTQTGDSLSSDLPVKAFRNFSIR